MGITIYEPRDERYGEFGRGLGAGVGAYFGQRAQEMQAQRQRDRMTQASMRAAAATNEAEYIRAFEGVVQDPATLMAIMDRAGKKFSEANDTYKISYTDMQTGQPMDMEFVAKAGMSTNQLNDMWRQQGWEQRLGPMNMGVPRAPRINLQTLQPVRPEATGTPQQAQRLEAARASRAQAAKARAGARPDKAGLDARAELVTRGVREPSEEQIARMRTVQGNRAKADEILTKVFADKIGFDFSVLSEEKGPAYTWALARWEDEVYATGDVFKAADRVATAARNHPDFAMHFQGRRGAIQEPAAIKGGIPSGQAPSDMIYAGTYNQKEVMVPREVARSEDAFTRYLVEQAGWSETEARAHYRRIRELAGQ